MSFMTSDPGADPIEMEAVFAASPARVYRAWTEPERLLRWFGRVRAAPVSAELDVRVGGLWRVRFAETAEGLAALEGAYLAVEPDARLAFTWRHAVERDGAVETSPESRVDIRFLAEGAATRLVLRHEGVARPEARRNVGGGWSETLARLAASLEADGAAA